MDWTTEAFTMMRRVSAGETNKDDAEIQTMLLAGIADSLKRIADQLETRYVCKHCGEIGFE